MPTSTLSSTTLGFNSRFGGRYWPHLRALHNCLAVASEDAEGEVDGESNGAGKRDVE